jgi:hypothetical protein
MSVQQYFSEVEAVVSILDGYTKRHGANGSEPAPRPDEEEFTAIWQAAELLARAHAYITAQINAEMAMAALNLPDVQQPPKPTLYGPDGGAL